MGKLKGVRVVQRSDKGRPLAVRRGTKRAPTWCPVCGRKHSKDDACEPRPSR